MQRISVSSWFLPLLFMLASSATSFGLQATNVWVDGNGAVHIGQASPAQPAAAPQAAPVFVPPTYYPPGQGPQPAAAPAASYAAWQDPAESAFTVSLPVSWQISGGTVRTTQIEVHYVVRAQSPDGGVQLFMDDPNILIREVPNKGT